MIGEHMLNVGFTDHNQLNINPHIVPAWDNRVSVQLFLFSPSLIAPEARHSHLYTLNDQTFLQSIYQTMEEQVTLPVDSVKASYMYGKPGASRAIVPNAYGQEIDLSPFEHMWKFILKVDNDPITTHQTGMNTPLINTCRILYSGVCLEEPCNPMAVNGHTSINMSCMLKIMHQTYVNVDSSVTSSGPWNNARVTHDRHIIRPEFIRGTDATEGGHAEVLLSPAAVRSSYHPDGYGSHTYSPVNAYVRTTGMDAGILMETDISSPRKHLQSLIQPIINTTQSLSTDMTISPRVVDNSFSASIADQSVIRDSFETATRTAYDMHTRPLFTQLDPTQLVSIQGLYDKYPSLTIQPLKVPMSIPVDVRDPFSVDPTNTMTSIITSSTPALLTLCGLSNVSFSYESDLPGNLFRADGPNDAFQVHDIGSIIVEPEEITMSRWRGFIDHMRNQVFSTIRELAGEFSASISVQSAGACYVQLHLRDHYNQGTELGVTNNIYSGINSPLIGATDHLEHNVTEFSNMLPALASYISAY